MQRHRVVVGVVVGTFTALVVASFLLLYFLVLQPPKPPQYSSSSSAYMKEDENTHKAMQDDQNKGMSTTSNLIGDHIIDRMYRCNGQCV